MESMWRVLCVILAVGCSGCAATEPTSRDAERPIAWTTWSDEAFEQAGRERRFVLLDLEAVWCHWCHVMEETTYKDPEVAALIRDHFIAVKVDQDSRPDLSNRYEDYGWPATIVFDASGGEIVKRSGYIAPAAMASMLRAIVEDPTPGPSIEASRNIAYVERGEISATLREELDAAFNQSYDEEHAGFGFSHKFLDAASVELLMARALDGDASAERKARATLDAALALVDPVWGGVYQYSTGGVWSEPHFEKIMSMQADSLRVYARAYAAWKKPEHLAAARSIAGYLATMLTSDAGAFYTSQDADLVQGEHSAEYFALSDAERRARGIPRIDTHVYARENGWAIRGLTELYAASGDDDALWRARRAAEWIGRERSLDGGGFRHDERDPSGPYFGDTLAMGQAYLALYAATAERAWLERAERASDFIARNFAIDVDGAGFATVKIRASSRLASQGPQRDENLAIARFENLLRHYTGRPEHGDRAERAMRFLATPEVARTLPVSRALLADFELTRDPMHITIVGPKSDPKALELFRTAISIAAPLARIEWWDSREGPLANADVEYPELGRPAAFLCAEGRCSSPQYDAHDLESRAQRSLRRQTP